MNGEGSGSARTEIADEDGLPKGLRQQRIAEVARQGGFVSVGELSRRFGVSEVTIRGDLQELEERRVLRRVRGGATAQANPQPERPFVQSLGANAAAKAAIASAAADLVTPGQSILLDVGTTTTALAQVLAEREDLTDVVAFTNAIPVALALEPAIPRCSVVLTGGTLRPLQHSLVDPLGDAVLERINVDTAFLGCNGVHPTQGVTNINLPEAAMKRRMIRAARRRIVVADGSKVGAVTLAPLCGVNEIDMLVTDPSADTEILALLREAGVRVEVAG
jgi:DeoR family transcriptional regulator, aga operon transcriptional repressor